MKETKFRKYMYFKNYLQDLSLYLNKNYYNLSEEQIKHIEIEVININNVLNLLRPFNKDATEKNIYESKMA